MISGVSGLVKEPRRIEVSEQIRGSLLVEVAGADLAVAHRRPHCRGVVPHRAGQRRRSEIAVDAAPQISRDVPALAVDAMALDTRKTLEQSFAASRIRGDDCGIPDPPLFALLLIISYGVMANVCYTLGAFAEIVAIDVAFLKAVFFAITA